jgi:hypothetical protein
MTRTRLEVLTALALPTPQAEAARRSTQFGNASV